MTLILSAANTSFVAQSGDRRVTRSFPGSAGTPEPYDYTISENKQVIFLASDGIAVFGYSGQAYRREGVTTDTWLAHVLFGAPVDPLGPLAQIEQHPITIRESIEVVASRAAAEGDPALRVAAVGWRQHPGTAARPFLTVIDNHSPFGGADRLRRRTRGAYTRALDVGGPISEARLRALEADLGQMDPSSDFERISERLYEETKDCAGRSVTVGGECLTVMIPNPDRVRAPLIRTAMRGGSARVQLKRGGTVEHDQPVTFTPWIVGGNVAVPPYCHNVSRVMKVGSYSLVPKPPPGEDGPLVFLSVPYVRSDTYTPTKGSRALVARRRLGRTI